uniref:Uncharacterized protein n=1 Tax=Rhizophora mucronata TaxID=61149 RepID=A0A2P2P4X9_RHIMU
MDSSAWSLCPGILLGPSRSWRRRYWG